MGRGHESQVRVNDISVSRTHALIKYRKDQGIYLADNKSKFGTLILMRQDSEQLEKDQDYLYQIGRTVVSLRVTVSTDLSPESSFDQGELSSAEHGQTEPFCSSQSSEEDEQAAKMKKSCVSTNTRRFNTNNQIVATYGVSA